MWCTFEKKTQLFRHNWWTVCCCYTSTSEKNLWYIMSPNSKNPLYLYDETQPWLLNVGVPNIDRMLVEKTWSVACFCFAFCYLPWACFAKYRVTVTLYKWSWTLTLRFLFSLALLICFLCFPLQSLSGWYIVVASVFNFNHWRFVDGTNADLRSTETA